MDKWIDYFVAVTVGAMSGIFVALTLVWIGVIK